MTDDLTHAVREARDALAKLLAHIDQCPRMERGAGGMTIDAQVRRTFIRDVSAWEVDTARDALDALDAALDAQPEADIKMLEAALIEIAKQKLTREMGPEAVDCYADFEGGYDTCIATARAALAKETKP